MFDHQNFHDRLNKVEGIVMDPKGQLQQMELTLAKKIDTKAYVALLSAALLVVLGAFYYLLDRQDAGFRLMAEQINEFKTSQAVVNKEVTQATSAVENINKFLDRYNWEVK